MTNKPSITELATVTMLIVQAALLWSPPAAGAEGRFKKKELEIEGGEQTALTQPRAPVKAPPLAGPVLTVEAFEGRQREKINRLTDKQIRYMRDLAANAGNDDPQKPDYHFRLGELLADKRRLLTFDARALDQALFDAQAAQQQARAAELKRGQQRLEGLAEDSARQAVKSYLAASAYPKYPRMDEVLYRLGHLLQTIGKEDQARALFHRLVKDHPQSKLVPHAYLSLAEYFFQKGEMEGAGRFYDKVTQFPSSPVFGYALYKRGWVAINLGDFKVALATFVDVIELCEGGRIPKDQAGLLAREARRDLVKAYARTPGAGAGKAWAFFQRMGGNEAAKMLESLAQLYWEQGMFVESSQAYRKMIALHATSPRLCEWQEKILRNSLSSGSKSEQVQELRRLGNVYEVTVKRPDVKPDLARACRNVYHDTARELALIWHKEAQRTKNAETYRLAGLVYQELLGHFADEKETAEMTFYHGEVLWQLNAWQEAAEAYTKAVRLDPQGRYVKEAAYAAVLAWKNALDVSDHGEDGAEENGRARELAPRAIPESQQKMIAAFDTYIRYVPDAPELVKIKYRKARILYDFNHFAEASRLFAEIVERHVNDGLAIYSANLHLDCLNILKRHKELRQTVDAYLADAVLMREEDLRRQMVSLKSDLMVADALQYEREKNYRDCGATFIAAAETMPTHKDHAIRLYNAGLCFQNAHLVGQAIKAREELIHAHPKDPLAQRALLQVASGYHQLAYYAEAAKRYEEFTKQYPGHEQAVTALGNAYTLRIGLLELDKAIDDMNSFVRYYGDKRPAEAANVVFQMSEVYEKREDTEELAKNLEAYLRDWGTKGGIDKQILAHFRLGEIAWNKSCAQGSTNGACVKIERVVMDGTRKAMHQLNSRIKDRTKRLRESPSQCGSPTRSKITVYDRSARLADQAQKHFDEVLRLWSRSYRDGRLHGQSTHPGELATRAGYMRFAAAGAAFYKAERVYEQFLEIKFPQALDFQRPDPYDSRRAAAAKQRRYVDSERRFLAYLAEKGRLVDQLAGPSRNQKGMYDLVLDYHVAHWTIAAAARMGQVFGDFANQLYTAEIPKELKEEDAWGNRPRDLFCDALADKAEPIETKAVAGYWLCLNAATKESWFNEWSATCEVELNQLKPAEYPLAVEAKPEPEYNSPPMSSPSLLTTLPEDIETVTGARASGRGLKRQ